MSTYVLWAMIRRQSYGTETDKREAKLAEVEMNELINDSQKADRLDLELLNLQSERDELRAALQEYADNFGDCECPTCQQARAALAKHARS
jgi:hypothetical protein